MSRDVLRPALLGFAVLALACSSGGEGQEGNGFFPDWGPGQGNGAEDTGTRDTSIGNDDTGTGGGDDTGSGGDDTGPIDTGPIDTGDPGPTLGSKDNPKVPSVGEVAIAELMVTPSEASQADGEWVEITNTSDLWLKTGTCTLRDEGSDKATLSETKSKSLIMEPGETLVLCANDSTWDNGGVDCQGTYSHGKFELNGSDAAILYCDGQVDKVRWSSGWAESGASMGVDGGKVDTSKNDNLDNWCVQGGFLSNGDYGNPGYGNDWCF
jgi:hypothetical protein